MNQNPGDPIARGVTPHPAEANDAAPRMSGWAWILLAGLFEVGFTYALKMQQQDSRWTVGFIVMAVLSFQCLSKGIQTVPLSIGYAVWTGIGSVGAFVTGIVAFGDSASLVRVLLVSGLILALVTLKLVSTSKPSAVT